MTANNMNNFIADGANIVNCDLGANNKIYKNCRLKNVTLNSNSVIGDNTIVENSTLNIYNNIQRYNYIADTVINSFSYTGMNTVIMHADIGKFCSISWGVTIGGGEHDFSNLTSHAFLYNDFFELNSGITERYDRFKDPCMIANDVWIGANSTILRNVRIGDGAVIGANALVSKDVPPYAIVGGCPAKVIKYRYNEAIIAELLELKWWDLPPEMIKNNGHLFSKGLDNKLLAEIKRIKKDFK